jgi:hypothetical protein
MDPVDLALVLAFDCSASVTYEEFGLIAGGCAAALRDPDVLIGLTHGAAGASLCALVLWSAPGEHKTLVDWTRIVDASSLGDFADAVDNVPRMVRAGSTAIGEALRFCGALLAAAPAEARQRIIDVAGDGRSNDGEPPGPVRDWLVADGVTINGLCVLHDEPDLVESYRREVIGGAGSFVVACEDYGGFAEAMRQKLRQEVAMLHPNRTAAGA